jgi:hypothetical protein
MSNLSRYYIEIYGGYMNPILKNTILFALRAQLTRLTAMKDELCPTSLAVMIDKELVNIKECIELLSSEEEEDL